MTREEVIKLEAKFDEAFKALNEYKEENNVTKDSARDVLIKFKELHDIANTAFEEYQNAIHELMNYSY